MRHPTDKSVFHSEFDNFDAFVTELYGAGSVHTSHGIMLQDVQSDDQADLGETASHPKTKERSLANLVDDVLPDCYISPNLTITNESNLNAKSTFQKSTYSNLLWVLLRKTLAKIPGWSGYISLTGQPPDNLTKIGYYPGVHHPITEYSTIQQCLKMAEQATKEVGQQYVISTFDLGVCMKAYPLIWNDPVKYKNHIVLIGTFHLMCAYFKMIGKKMDSSGITDVMSGKNYSRAMVCHKIVLESLEKLLLKTFLSQTGQNEIFETLPDESKEKVKKVKLSLNKKSIEDLLNDNHITS